MRKNKIAVIGLGYVGLPLAIAFGHKFETIGFDINIERIKQLKKSIDVTDEVTAEEISEAGKINFSHNEKSLADCDVYVITVPTPINKHKEPDLSFLEKATMLIAKYLKNDDLVIYESTVYPGVTEDFCGKIISTETGLEVNKDISLGYSPERINPGDKDKRLKDITKVVSASNNEALKVMEYLYGSIIEAGIYSAESIKTAEAAKVIENTQRDVNIGLINEFSKIFQSIGVDTHSVLDTASTKWNFIKFQPGLVGGHCIGVDPFYLAHVAKKNNVDPRIILSARDINDGMASHSAHLLNASLLKKNIEKAKILIKGATFKENCPDFRNTKVVDLYNSLRELGHAVQLTDPHVDVDLFKKEYGITINNQIHSQKYDAVVLAVPHKEYINENISFFYNLIIEGGIFFDLKSVFPSDTRSLRL